VLGFLALIYGLGALWLPSRFAGQSPLFVAGSTLIVAALFNPVRRWVVRAVDRRFYRSRYDAEQVSDGFIERMQDETDMGRLSAELVSVVTATMQPEVVRLWARDAVE
jgi:hypothetical protein